MAPSTPSSSSPSRRKATGLTMGLLLCLVLAASAPQRAAAGANDVLAAYMSKICTYLAAQTAYTSQWCSGAAPGSISCTVTNLLQNSGSGDPVRLRSGVGAKAARTHSARLVSSLSSLLSFSPQSNFWIEQTMNQQWFQTPIAYQIAPPQGSDADLTPSTINSQQGTVAVYAYVNNGNVTAQDTAQLQITTTTSTSFARQQTFQTGLSAELSFEVDLGEPPFQEGALLSRG